MKTAVMYGAGNIGRGFVGALMGLSGYEVTFIDVAEPVVERLRADRSYPVRIVSDEGNEDIIINNVTAVDGNDAGAVADAIAGCSLMATAVGARVLKFIVPNIVEGLRRRRAAGAGPLNIIICENINDANKVLEAMIRELLTPEEQETFSRSVGLVEASIGRMVPVQTEEMKDGEPLRVCVERYGFLPVDKAAFKGPVPDIKGLVPHEPFDFYVKRKLFIHNMGHATAAYIGGLFQYKYISDAIDNPEIRLIVQNAMLETGLALSRKYGAPLADIQLHISDLLYRFGNSALGDTCERVGRDPARKLGPDDRLAGAARMAMEEGVCPAYIALGAAAAVVRQINETSLIHGINEAWAVLSGVSGLAQDDRFGYLALDFYRMIIEGASLKTLRRAAEKAGHDTLKDII